MSLRFQRETAESRSLSINLGLLTLRVLSVAALVYYELALHLGKAWKNVWKEEHWGLIDQFNRIHLPLPGAVGVAVILGSLLTSLGVLLGFLGRVNAVLLILILAFFLVARVQLSDNFTPEVIVIYIIILLTLTITGGGRYSMDHLLTDRRGKNQAD